MKGEKMLYKKKSDLLSDIIPMNHKSRHLGSDSLLLSLPPPFHQVMLYGITGA
jgi:hypothetical protein